MGDSTVVYAQWQPRQIGHAAAWVGLAMASLLAVIVGKYRSYYGDAGYTGINVYLLAVPK